MAAASIVHMTACYLCTRPHGEKGTDEEHRVAPEVNRLCATLEHHTTEVPLQVLPSAAGTRPDPHSQRLEPLVFTHISAQPPLPFAHSFTSEDRTYTTTGSDVIVR